MNFIRFLLITCALGMFSSLPGTTAYAVTVETPVAKPPLVKNYLEDTSNTPTQELRGTSANENLFETGPKKLNDYFFGFFGIIAIIIALRSGTKIIFSNGDAKTFKDGIMTLVNAAIGIVVIGSSWSIIRIILQINLG